MTNDQQMQANNKAERIEAMRALLAATLDRLIATGRMNADKREEAEKLAATVIARAEAADPFEFLGADNMGDAGVQNLLGKFNKRGK